VILRQILFSLLNYALDMRSDGPIAVIAESHPDRILLRVQFQAGP